MLKRPTLSVARPVAETLARNGLVLTPKSEQMPVGMMASYFRTAIDPTYQYLTTEGASAVVETLQEANATPDEQQAEEFDQLTDLMAQGLQRMLTTVRGVVVPTCKAIKASYDTVSEETRVPTIRVTPYVFQSVHDEPALTTHVLDQYSRYRPRDSYRSFIMDCPSQETLIEWLANNKHLDEQQTRTWLAHINYDENVYDTWYQMFGNRRELAPSDMSFTGVGRLPFCIDQLLVAYLLTAYLCHEPQDVVGESVSLEEWERALGQLHELLGSQLAQAYSFRVRARQREMVVFRYDLPTTGEITVHTNGDIYHDWLEAGGDIKELLGAAVTAPTRRHAKDLAEVKDDLIRAWDRKHHLLRQTKLDEFMRRRRDILRQLLKHPVIAGSDENAANLPTLGDEELTRRIHVEVQALREDDLDDAWRTITRLVCNVYYPDTPYGDFLQAMDRVAKDNPDMPPRELATLATIEMTALWLSKQIRSTPFEDDVRQGESQPDLAAPGEAEEPSEESTEAEETTTDDDTVSA